MLDTFCRSEQAKYVVTDVDFETWKDCEWFAPELSCNAPVLLDKVGKEPVPWLAFR